MPEAGKCRQPLQNQESQKKSPFRYSRKGFCRAFVIKQPITTKKDAAHPHSLLDRYCLAPDNQLSISFKLFRNFLAGFVEQLPPFRKALRSGPV